MVKEIYSLCETGVAQNIQSRLDELESEDDDNDLDVGKDEDDDDGDDDEEEGIVVFCNDELEQIPEMEVRTEILLLPFGWYERPRFHSLNFLTTDNNSLGSFMSGVHVPLVHLI